MSAFTFDRELLGWERSEQQICARRSLRLCSGTVDKHPQTMHMGDGAAQMCQKPIFKLVFPTCTPHHSSQMFAFSLCFAGEVFDYLVAHGRMKEKEARAKFRQVPRSAPVSHLCPLARVCVCHLQTDDEYPNLLLASCCTHCQKSFNVA